MMFFKFFNFINIIRHNSLLCCPIFLNKTNGLLFNYNNTYNNAYINNDNNIDINNENFDFYHYYFYFNAQM
jgi:hypothetical protein